MVKKILIVDDDPDFVEMNKAVLENNNFAVLTAHNAKDGIKLIKEQKPHLLMLDVMMGSDVEGFDAVEEIRKLPEGEKLPILMITSFDKHHGAPWEGKPDRTWVDVDNYLSKPVAPDKLIGEISRLLG